jgi:hypothetical protein
MWKSIRNLKLPETEYLELLPDVDPVEELKTEEIMINLNDPKQRLLKSDLSDYDELKDLVKEFDLKPSGRSKNAYIAALKAYRDENL